MKTYYACYKKDLNKEILRASHEVKYTPYIYPSGVRAESFEDASFALQDKYKGKKVIAITEGNEGCIVDLTNKT